MDTKFDRLLAAIGPEILEPLVNHAFGLTQMTAMAYHKFRGGTMGGVGDLTSGSAGVARFSGTGLRADQQQIPWSLILKVLPSSVDGPDQQEATREWYAYQSGLLDDHSGGLIAPRLYGVLEQPSAVRGLWLEDIIETGDPVWSTARYALAARHLGQFNGNYITPNRLQGQSNTPWLGKQWLRGRMLRRAPMLPVLRQSLNHPLVQRLYSKKSLEFALHLWAEHLKLLDILDHLPQTLCHQDAFRRNLFARGTQTVAVDWAFMGHAAVGAEIAPLVWVSAIFQEIAAHQIVELDSLVFDNYLTGLRNSGWDGDVRAVRFAYLVTALLNVSIPTEFLSFMDPQKHSALEQGFGYSVEEIIDNWAKLLAEAERFSGELRDLTAVLG